MKDRKNIVILCAENKYYQLQPVKWGIGEVGEVRISEFHPITRNENRMAYVKHHKQ